LGNTSQDAGLLRGEIALHNENGVMEHLDNPEAYYDDRSIAQLIRALVDVLGGTMRPDLNAVSVTNPSGTHSLKPPQGEYLIMDQAAKLERGCTVAVFLAGDFMLVGRIVRPTGTWSSAGGNARAREASRGSSG
jgi:hypothetical protein